VLSEEKKCEYRIGGGCRLDEPRPFDCGMCILSALVPISDTLLRMLLKLPLSEEDSRKVFRLMRDLDMTIIALDKFTHEHFSDRLKEFLEREGLRRGYIN